jgi:hypothetical protein
MILGEEPAPWEHPATINAMLRPLGYFRDPVLALLDRNSNNRPTMPQFILACRRVLTHSYAPDSGT